jgi:hypothetical protein
VAQTLAKRPPFWPNCAQPWSVLCQLFGRGWSAGCGPGWCPPGLVATAGGRRVQATPRALSTRARRVGRQHSAHAFRARLPDDITGANRVGMPVLAQPTCRRSGSRPGLVEHDSSPASRHAHRQLNEHRRGVSRGGPLHGTPCSCIDRNPEPSSVLTRCFGRGTDPASLRRRTRAVSSSRASSTIRYPSCRVQRDPFASGLRG